MLVECAGEGVHGVWVGDGIGMVVLAVIQS